MLNTRGKQMKKCLECGKEFDETKRTGEFWIRQYENMGAMADICEDCWKKEYRVDVTKFMEAN